MPSRDSIVRDLLEKLRDAPPQELSEVVDFAELLRTRRKLAPADVSAQTAQAAIDALEEREQHAAAAGLLRLPEPNARKLSTVDAPPVLVSGRPASELVLEDRR